MTDTVHRTHKDHSGILIRGTERVSRKGLQTTHMGRVVYLVAQLESSKWGSVQSYDGAGISAGILHNTAILPNAKKQGSLWALLYHLQCAVSDSEALNEIWNELVRHDMYVSGAPIHALCHWDTGLPVHADDILDLLAPPGGKVPEEGPEWDQAVKWATLFHEAFADPSTFDAQFRFASDYLLSNRKGTPDRSELAWLYGGRNPETLLTISNLRAGSRTALTHFEDLAIATYHAFSVNAPSRARKVLRQTRKEHEDIDAPFEMHNLFYRNLVRNLGTNSYGNWKDDRRGHNRYDRTRRAALKSGMWDPDLFGPRGLMPDNFV